MSAPWRTGIFGPVPRAHCERRRESPGSRPRRSNQGSSASCPQYMATGIFGLAPTVSDEENIWPPAHGKKRRGSSAPCARPKATHIFALAPTINDDGNLRRRAHGERRAHDSYPRLKAMGTVALAPTAKGARKMPAHGKRRREPSASCPG